MPRYLDLTGRVFSRLTVVNVDHPQFRGGKHRTAWLCKCECGKDTVVLSQSLMDGNTQSCGCFLRERQSTANATHSMSKTRTYFAWRAAKQRCENPKHQSYKHYGARGIYMCNEWKDAFEAFLRDMGPAPDGLELERTDNCGPYTPENCIWATRSVQMLNTRRSLKNRAA